MNNLSLLQISVDNQNPFIHIIVEVEMIFTVDKAITCHKSQYFIKIIQIYTNETPQRKIALQYFNINTTVKTYKYKVLAVIFMYVYSRMLSIMHFSP